MTRLPTCTAEMVLRAIERAGFSLDHSTSSHRFYRHPDRPGIVTIPYHRKDLKRGTLLAILKRAGLSREEFLRLL